LPQNSSGIGDKAIDGAGIGGDGKLVIDKDRLLSLREASQLDDDLLLPSPFCNNRRPIALKLPSFLLFSLGVKQCGH
jgi:hypothetical protein